MANAGERAAKKKLVLEKWAEWEAAALAKGEFGNQAGFIANSKGTDWETNISSLRNYTGKNAKATSKTKTTTTAAKPAPTTLAGMRAELALQQEALEKRKADYKKLLEGEIVRLKGELEKAELELLEYEEEFQVLDTATDQANQN